MGEDRKEEVDHDPKVHPIDYARVTGPGSRHNRLAERLTIEAIFAIGAALSFIAAYSFYVELVTRPATPTSLMDLYAPSVGCVAFAIGLARTLLKGREERVWDAWLRLCLIVGVAAALLTEFFPCVWR